MDQIKLRMERNQLIINAVHDYDMVGGAVLHIKENMLVCSRDIKNDRYFTCANSPYIGFYLPCNKCDMFEDSHKL